MRAEKEVAAQVLSSACRPRPRSKFTPWTGGETAALFALIDRLKRRAANALSVADVPILCCDEAGYKGFGLYRRPFGGGTPPARNRPSQLVVNAVSSARRRIGSTPRP